jgi:integrase
MWQLLKRLNRPGLTIHGFRSTISDWCAERTNYPREVAEATLAHAQGDKVEAAYRRSDLLVRRRHMLAEWAKYCENSSGAGKVLSLSKRSNTAT